MADLIFLAIRTDLERAATLAHALGGAGLSIESPFSAEALESCGAVVVVWSRAASRCEEFVESAQAAIGSGKAMIACLNWPGAEMETAAPCFDLSAWRGDLGADALDDFFYAVYSKAVAARRDDEAEEALEEDDLLAAPEAESAVIALWDAPPAREDSAKFALAWSSDLPDKPLAVPQSRAPKRKRRSGRALLFAVRAAGVALLIGAAVFAEAVHASAPRLHDALPTSFASVSMDYAGESAAPDFVDVTPTPPPWLREPASAPRS